MYGFLFGVLFILFQFVYILAKYTYNGEQLISSQEAITKGDIQHVIDVRTHAEYQLGHLEGSIHLPVHLISKSGLKKSGIRKSDSVLVYCNTGQRARFAAEKMKRLKYTNVLYIAGTYNSLQ
jgi:phage shock protein E